MKKEKATGFILCGVLILSLSACGQKAPEPTPSPAGETLTGTAEGYGGPVKVSLTRDNGVITACSIQGEKETPEVGGKALPQLEEQVVAANGWNIDGVAGATMTSRAVKKAVAECLGETYEEEVKPVETAGPAANIKIEGGLQLGQTLGAAHGTQCFTQAYAAVWNDTVVAAYIDDFQFVDTSMDLPGVPNSDGELAQGFAEGQLLTTKRTIAPAYSKIMAEHGGATLTIDANFDAIQSYAVGKTIAELETAAADPKIVDAVSGATLTDTAGYLGVIAQAARNAQETQAVEFSGDSDALKLSAALGAAHGTRCFTSAAALTEGSRILLCHVDDFQFMDADPGLAGVPNSDGELAQGFAEGQILTTKRMASPAYSKLMAERGGATRAIDLNFNAIQSYLSGMTITDAEALSQRSDAVDVVSGATLTDTAGYIGVIVDAAKS